MSDSWGKLSVTGGALVGINRDQVILSMPTTISKEKVAGDGWTLELNNGYIVEKNSTDDNYILKKEK
jgi:hypothetical protein